MLVGASYAARPPAAAVLAVALAIAGAALAVVVELDIVLSTTTAFAGTRLSWPLDYGNGALLFLGLPALLGAASRRPHPLLRAAVGGLAALLAAEGLMTLSRGSTIALAAALVAAVVLVGDRASFALTLFAVFVPVAAAASWLTGGDPDHVAADATAHAAAAGIAAVAAAALVGGLAVAERTSVFRRPRFAATAAAAVWAVVGLAAIAGFAVHYGRPDTWVQSRWHEFRHSHTARPTNLGRFATASSNRYDYWRVAAKTWEARPLEGVGAGAFAVPWYERRHIPENITDAHSWEFGALAETGAVGFLLLVGAFVLPLVALARNRRRAGSFVSAAFGGATVFFLLSASLDWLLRIPAVALAGFLVLGAAAAASAGEMTLVRGRTRLAFGAAALAAAALAVPTYLATTLTARAETKAATSTKSALDTLSLAATLHPWAVEPLIVKSAILLDSGRTHAAVKAAREATARGTNDWTAWVALAEAEARAGDRGAAKKAHRRAQALNPLLSRE